MTYLSQQKSAYNMIKAKGSTATFIIKASGTYNEITEVETVPYGILPETLAADATSITLSGVVGTIPSKGVVKIEDEYILFLSNTENVLSDLQRGIDINTFVAGSGSEHEVVLEDVPVSLVYTLYSGYKLISSFKAHLIDGERIKATDKLFLIPAYLLGATLTKDFKVVHEGSIWNIESLKTVAPDGDPILYYAQLRG